MKNKDDDINDNNGTNTGGYTTIEESICPSYEIVSMQTTAHIATSNKYVSAKLDA